MVSISKKRRYLWQYFDHLHKLLIYGVDFPFNHRRRIYTEEKEKVVAAVWAERIYQIPCRAIYFATWQFEEWIYPFLHIILVQIILFFISSWCKAASTARNWINSVLPHSSKNLCLLFCINPLLYLLSGPFPPDDPGHGVPGSLAGDLGPLPAHRVGLVEQLLDPGPDDHVQHGLGASATMTTLNVVLSTCQEQN